MKVLLAAGLVHPFGLDHLLAMVAVGIWSVSVLPAQRAWWGPATFMSSLVLGGAVGVSGSVPVSMAWADYLTSLSVVLFGLMLVLAQSRLSGRAGLFLIALAGTAHGLSHGADQSQTHIAAYAGGFLFTTAVLHGTGMLAGLGIRRHLAAARAATATSLLGLLLGGTGMYLLSQA